MIKWVLFGVFVLGFFVSVLVFIEEWKCTKYHHLWCNALLQFILKHWHCKAVQFALANMAFSKALYSNHSLYGVKI